MHKLKKKKIIMNFTKNKAIESPIKLVENDICKSKEPSVFRNNFCIIQNCKRHLLFEEKKPFFF